MIIRDFDGDCLSLFCSGYEPVIIIIMSLMSEGVASIGAVVVRVFSAFSATTICRRCSVHVGESFKLLLCSRTLRYENVVVCVSVSSRTSVVRENDLYGFG